MSEAGARHELVVVGGRFAVCRLPCDAVLPPPPPGNGFWSVTRNADEVSVVCREEAAPSAARAEPGWSCLKLLGPFEFSEIGVVARLTSVLAEAAISVFVVSTFDTDYILIREGDLPDAIDVLREAGHVVQF